MEVQVWFIGDKKVSVVQKFNVKVVYFNVKVVYFIEKTTSYVWGGQYFYYICSCTFG